jgi:hypothetical protein
LLSLEHRTGGLIDSLQCKLAVRVLDEEFVNQRPLCADEPVTAHGRLRE